MILNALALNFVPVDMGFHSCWRYVFLYVVVLWCPALSSSSASVTALRWNQPVNVHV